MFPSRSSAGSSAEAGLALIHAGTGRGCGKGRALEVAGSAQHVDHAGACNRATTDIWRLTIRSPLCQPLVRRFALTNQ